MAVGGTGSNGAITDGRVTALDGGLLKTGFKQEVELEEEEEPNLNSRRKKKSQC